MRSSLSICPSALPDDLRQHALALAQAWIESDLRPTPAPEVLKAWDALVQDWAASPEVPLLLRRPRGNRGCVIEHESGRLLVPVDNSPAHWSYALALGGTCFPIAGVIAQFEADAIPVAMAMNRAERGLAQYRCSKAAYSLNGLNWKVCHIDGVGLIGRGDIRTISIDAIMDHFVRLMSPSNMFVVPKQWSGLGEMPEMIEAARVALRR